MNLLEEFNKEFIKRHDFYSEDLDLLASKYNKTKLINIPEAWILPIDEMLLGLSNINIFPIYVEQKFGMLFVKYNEIKENSLEYQYNPNDIPYDKLYLKFQDTANIKIKFIDEDLYLFMDIDLYDIDREYMKKYPTIMLMNYN